MSDYEFIDHSYDVVVIGAGGAGPLGYGAPGRRRASTDAHLVADLRIAPAPAGCRTWLVQARTSGAPAQRDQQYQ